MRMHPRRDTARRVPTYVIAAVATLTALGAQPQRDPAQPTFRAGANYVRVDMYATQDGQPLHDLKAEEIEVLEDGVPQKLEDFEHVLVRPASATQTGREPDGLGASREAAADPRARVFVILPPTPSSKARPTCASRW